MMHNHSKTKAHSVAVVGARGYSGLELAKLLLHHPALDLTHCFATRAFSLKDELLDDRAAQVQCLTDDEILANSADIVFLATPADVSMELAPKIVALGKKVIDLSGAFRLSAEESLAHYGFAPPPKVHAAYGLVPFAKPLKSETQVIANPGCYATAVSLALLPLLKHELIDPRTLVIDAKSGTTGAGRKASENLLFSEVEGQCLPYRVGRHQHLPEIVQTVQEFSGQSIDPHFVTHLLPVKRGIIAAIFAEAKASDLKAIAAAFQAEYGHYPLVRHGEKIERLGNLNAVVGTPFTHISYALVGKKLYVFSCLDNLLKGAASQAIENCNRWLDLPVATGLLSSSQKVEA